MSFASGLAAGRRGVEPVDVRQQHQQIGAGHGGDARGEAVVVAVADFVGGDRVVLVDDRHGAPLQQARDGLACVEIAAALLGVLQVTRICPASMPRRRAHSDHMRASAIWPTAAAACCLPASARRAAVSARLRPSAIEPDETTSTSRARLVQGGDIGASAASHSRARRRGIDQQRRADLDDDAAELILSVWASTLPNQRRRLLSAFRAEGKAAKGFSG
jgi:hypothetical protein